jgi:hypothetical protein
MRRHRRHESSEGRNRTDTERGWYVERDVQGGLAAFQGRQVVTVSGSSWAFGHGSRIPEVLKGFVVSGEGTTAAAATCLRHLVELGATPVPDLLGTSGAGGSAGRITLRAAKDVGFASAWLAAGTAVTGELTWAGPVEDGPVDETTVQAMCGLMHVHGRRYGSPRPLGLPYASVTAGVLAAQGLLASLLAVARGQATRGRLSGRVATSVTQAGLLAVSQYLAAATAGDAWEPPRTPNGQAPPFRSADGYWFELEALDPEVWRSFWTRLKLEGPAVG